MFVEDEISKNIPRIIDLFESILSQEEKIKLNELENDELGMGACGEDIQEALKNNPVLEIFDTFTAALEHIMNLDKTAIDNYDLFIFDRNLTEEKSYDPSYIRKIDPSFDDVNYYQREGDFLARQLHLRGCRINEKVFFYSAYNRMNSALTDIDQMIGYGNFHQNNFYDKGNSAGLKEIIGSKTCALLLAEHSHLFDVLEKNNIDSEKTLLKLLLHDIEGRWEYDMGFRNIFDAILNELKSHPYWYIIPNDNDSLDNLIQKLDKNKVPPHVRKFMDNTRLLINKNAGHTQNSPDRRFCMSQYTYRAMLNSLLEIIDWFGTISKSRNDS